MGERGFKTSTASPANRQSRPVPTGASAASAVQAAQRRRGNQQTGRSVNAALERSSAEDNDSWTKLSAAGQRRAQALHDECLGLIGQLLEAQQAHVSVLRSHWLDFLTGNVLVRIGKLDSDSRIEFLENVLHDFAARISNNVADEFAKWEAVEHRYQDEHDWLARRHYADATLAAARLESLYNESRRWLDNGAASFITEEDFAELAATLASGAHISTGTLQASRARARQIDDILDTVITLRVTGANADEQMPGWRRQVENEIENLTRLASNTRATPGMDFPAEFSRLRNELRTKLDAAVQAQEREKTFSENVLLLLGGVVEGVAAPFIEVVREIVDLLQGAMLWVSGGRYQPEFTSALMKAFEQGATRTDILKSMLIDLIETPVRFVRAAQKGDWENIGKEGANLALLALLAKRTPGVVKRLPELAARLPELATLARRGLKAVRARLAIDGLSEPRMGIRSSSGPKGPTPRPPSGIAGQEPTRLTQPAASETPAGSAKTTPPETTGEPAAEVGPTVTKLGKKLFRVGDTGNGLSAEVSVTGKQLVLADVIVEGNAGGSTTRGALLNIARQVLKFAGEQGAETIRFKGFINNPTLRATYRTPRFDFTVPATPKGLASVTSLLKDNIPELEFITD